MAVLVPPKVVEGGTVRNTADFVIRLERPGPRPSTYSFSTGGGVATPGADYVSVKGTVTFQPGETTKVVSVEVIDDDLIEHDEDFYLAVKGRGRTAFGRAIIVDDDTPGPPVRVSNPVVPEGAGPIPSSRVRFLGPSQIRRLSAEYQVRIV